MMGVMLECIYIPNVGAEFPKPCNFGARGISGRFLKLRGNPTGAGGVGGTLVNTEM